MEQEQAVAPPPPADAGQQDVNLQPPILGDRARAPLEPGIHQRRVDQLGGQQCRPPTPQVARLLPAARQQRRQTGRRYRRQHNRLDADAFHAKEGWFCAK